MSVKLKPVRDNSNDDPGSLEIFDNNSANIPHEYQDHNFPLHPHKTEFSESSFQLGKLDGKDLPTPSLEMNDKIKRSHSETMVLLNLPSTSDQKSRSTMVCDNCGSNMKTIMHTNESFIKRRKQLRPQNSQEFYNLDSSSSFYGNNVPAAAYALAWATDKHKRFRMGQGPSCSSGDESVNQIKCVPEFLEEYKRNKVLIETVSHKKETSLVRQSTQKERPTESAIAQVISCAAIGQAGILGNEQKEKLTKVLKKTKNMILTNEDDQMKSLTIPIGGGHSSDEMSDTESPLKTERVQQRRGGGEVRRIIAPGGPLGSGVQPLVQPKTRRDNNNSNTLAKAQQRSVGWRLSRRRELNERRKRIFDYSLAFAVFGLAVVVLETELTLTKVYRKNEIYSVLMKSLISISTMILVFLIIIYNIIEIQLFSVNNCIEDWRIATNSRRISIALIEIFICIIHPPPFHINYGWIVRMDDKVQKVPSKSQDLNAANPCPIMMQQGISPNITITETLPKYNNHLLQPRDFVVDSETFFLHVDDILALLMFFRLYLIFRFLLLHSKMFTDTSSRSIGALNRVQFNIRFVLKTLMTICPGTILLVFILTFWIMFSWFMRVCERSHSGMPDTMWLIAITFLSIGYGDVVPHGPCGRSIAVVTGVLGSCCTALVVAVFARKLELTKAEKHVHNFMQDNKIYKRLRNAAANVLRETWLFYKYTKLVKRVQPSKVRAHQRKFLCAIHSLRKAKEDHRKLKDDASQMVDLGKLQNSIYETVLHIRSDQMSLNTRFQTFEDSLNNLKDELSRLPGLNLPSLNNKPAPAHSITTTTTTLHPKYHQ